MIQVPSPQDACVGCFFILGGFSTGSESSRSGEIDCDMEAGIITFASHLSEMIEMSRLKISRFYIQEARIHLPAHII